MELTASWSSSLPVPAPSSILSQVTLRYGVPAHPARPLSHCMATSARSDRTSFMRESRDGPLALGVPVARFFLAQHHPGMTSAKVLDGEFAAG